MQMHTIYKRTLAMLLPVISVAALFSGCAKSLSDQVAVEKTILDGITINTTSTLPLLMGKDSLLPVTIAPANASNTKLTWSSDDISIATVDSTGRVTAMSEGTAVITAASTDGGARTASIVVKAISKIIYITNISVNASGTTIYEGDTLNLSAIISPSDATYTTLQWSSSDTAIARVTNTGMLTATGKGTVTITAAAIDGSNVKGTISIEVKELVPVSGITVNDTFSESMGVGEQRAISLALTPSNASVHDLTFSSGNTGVATVSSDGVVTAVGAGTAVITIVTKNGNGVTAAVTVTVEEGKINDVFTGSTPWILVANASYPGGSYKLDGGIFNGTMGVNSSSVYRGDFQRVGGITVHAGNYPIIAFKMNRPQSTAGNLVLDTNNGTYLNGNNKMTTVTGKDNVEVQYADFASGYFGSGKVKLSTTSSTRLTTFQMKIADFKFTAAQLATGNNTYKVYWVKSFKSVTELMNYINK